MRSGASELSSVVSADTGASAIGSMRAVAIGAVVMVGGSLVMTTLIGTAAILGMIVRGDSGPTIVMQLTGSLKLALMCATGGWWMNLIGGYKAASMAEHAWIGHGFLAGALAVPFSLAIVVLLGDSGPLWLTVTSMVLIVPCATLGGWLAAPAQDAPAVPQLRR